MTKNSMEASGPSRRTFLKGVALGGAAMVAAGMVEGCAPQTKGEDEGLASTGSVAMGGDHAPVVTETDVVVVGAGLAGLFAARNAMKKGQRVVIVDKGLYGHSGASGINWGHSMFNGGYQNGDIENNLNEYLQGRLLGNDGVAPQGYMGALVKASQDLRIFDVATEIGCVVERSGEDGSVVGNDFLMHGFFPRILASQVRRDGAVIKDRCMMLDILQADDGSAAGVVAMDLVNGTAQVVRAKSVVMAMGSGCWCDGWSGVGAETSSGLEQTGDGQAILLGHGVALTALEYFMPYWYSGSPASIARCQNLGFALNDHPEKVQNGQGDNFYVDSQAWADAPVLPTYWKVGMKEVYEGRATENGGIYMDITDIDQPQAFLRFNRRMPENQLKALGYEVPNPCEVLPTPWETHDLPKTTDDLEVEDIPGLFIAKSSFGTFFASTAGGHLAGGSAAQHAMQSDYKNYDASTAQEIVDNAYAALENENSGKRANEIQHDIQRLVGEYLVFGRSEDGINAAIAELDRIKEEDLPNMVVTDKSRRFNYEWRQAMEVPFMWTYARAVAEAALNRRETRYTHHRIDYPNIDHENGFTDMWVSVQDGVFSANPEPIDDRYIPIDELRAIIPEIGIGEYPQA
ncbi:FAD-dependent oxidoreductase [uncultured Adlercreutzia sp.]|uniref:FAD-dependent oxidoreductase n=1 Tax=uncultured Adlercreutzia sp. TaxID=875803 RepID=UPI0026F3CBDD|nr:FAD-dependent oxidoreductase [uncultured Adlercreutzia sp.]